MNNSSSFYLYSLCSLILLGLSNCQSSQSIYKVNYEEIEAKYTSLETSTPPSDSCGVLRFIQAEDQLIPEGKELLQIMLIRHGKPIINKKGYFNFYEAEGYIKEYDSTGVETFAQNPICIDPNEVKEIYCSPLNRSRQTARMLFGPEFRIVINSRFREFERRIYPIPAVSFKLKFWLLLSRLSWILGGNDDGIESFKQAKQRARGNAQLLAERAQKDQKVILVAHGFLNRFLVKYLEDLGWEHVRDGGSGYLSVQVLVKLVDKS